MTYPRPSLELFTPDALVARAEPHGFVLREACCWWDAARPPDPAEQRYQLVLDLSRQGVVAS